MLVAHPFVAAATLACVAVVASTVPSLRYHHRHPRARNELDA